MVKKQATMDWEKFKEETAALNESVSEEEKNAILEEAAEEVWNANKGFISLVRPHQIDNPREPVKLRIYAAQEVKRQLFIAQYMKLIRYVTGSNGLYPERLDFQALVLQKEVVKRKNMSYKGVIDWIRDHCGEYFKNYYANLRKTET